MRREIRAEVDDYVGSFRVVGASYATDKVSGSMDLGGKMQYILRYSVHRIDIAIDG